jgi:hypothetical protein
LDGIQVIVISEQQKAKAEAQFAAGGAELRTLNVYTREFNQSFQYQFVDVGSLNREEGTFFGLTPRILNLVGFTQARAPQVRVSETMRLTSDDTEGVWDSELQAIVIHRPCLSSLERYAGTLLHELAHFASGASDATREFESV